MSHRPDRARPIGTVTPEEPHPYDNTQAALDTARRLASAGVPVFLAYPSDNKAGYTPPAGWERTAPDPAVVDRWEPGLALCAVMGQGLDLIDIDPRNGGQWPDEVPMPKPVAVAVTPSGGTHHFISSLGVGSRDNVFPGIDVKGGRSDGTGRGFAFIAPTIRRSVVDGVERAYRWHRVPDLNGDLRHDDSGKALADCITVSRGPGVPKLDGAPDWWRDFRDNKAPQSEGAADKAITDKLDAVRTWTPGSGVGFRQTLMRASMTLGGYVGGGWLDEEDARGRLEDACGDVWGDPDDDDRLWIEQGLADGARQPFFVFTPEDEQRHAEAGGDGQVRPVLPPPSAPLAVARELILAYHTTLDGWLVLRRWRGDWVGWRGSHWLEVEDTAIRKWLYLATEHADYWRETSKGWELTPWVPNARKISDIQDATKAVTLLSDTTDTPSWLDGPNDEVPLIPTGRSN